jgi:hypothetical protein
MYILYFIYSIVAGMLAYAVFRRELIDVIIFIAIFEMLIYILYRRWGYYWYFENRVIFNILFFFGYFSFFILYSDFDITYDTYNNK